MNTTTRGEYLGRPCPIVEAFDMFEDAVDEARSMTAHDPQSIYYQVGAKLVQGRQQMQHLIPAIEALIDALPNNTDADQALAIAQMMRGYLNTVEDAAFDLAGLVLVGLARAGAVKEPLQEVAA